MTVPFNGSLSARVLSRALSPSLCPPVGLVSEYGITFQTHFVDKFGVSFGREGETMSLGCTVIINPTLERYQPEVEWYRDGEQPTPRMPGLWVAGSRCSCTTH